MLHSIFPPITASTRTLQHVQSDWVDTQAAGRESFLSTFECSFKGGDDILTVPIFGSQSDHRVVSHDHKNHHFLPVPTCLNRPNPNDQHPHRTNSQEPPVTHLLIFPRELLADLFPRNLSGLGMNDLKQLISIFPCPWIRARFGWFRRRIGLGFGVWFFLDGRGGWGGCFGGRSFRHLRIEGNERASGISVWFSGECDERIQSLRLTVSELRLIGMSGRRARIRFVGLSLLV
jgi:hypothetical protein